MKAANSMGCLSRAARTHCPTRSKVSAHRPARLSPSGPAQEAQGRSGDYLLDMMDISCTIRKQCPSPLEREDNGWKQAKDRKGVF